MTEDADDVPGGLNVSPTGWALLGMLSGGEEMSGYDIKKWINWAIRFFYSSPAYSQIYSELKRLERLGLVSSRVDAGVRSRRMYKITESGLAAVTRWANEDPVEAPTLKHNPILRMMLGHLLKPGRLREILAGHAAYAEQLQQAAATEVRWTSEQPAWSYARLALKWSEQYYAAERELALQMIKDLDAAEEAFGEAGREGVQFPMPEYWYEVERRIAAEDTPGVEDPSA
ncbi:PadR family transcriptional regulator [Mycolicibacterium austroafricanum]|uniref:PadR family transcriptional regulator n=2 Tax=Mycobacteriaceae TaxID=1762 RepID=A0ABT8HJ37_MYCAO|nr:MULTISPECIES: PadR family transcriptional regulator [Mycolicibacterium]MCV7126589.1 PadR family transcriptional regulator [Mycolicibacterium vanbaalenii PYR-1]MDN4520785.1 PadR family transcriptional regulator [Mycolicibacterium austroafricanum]PQP49806.1 PadR family transcriptional regulator [Mycolicibacterium austroafricanum]QRZ09431.1 PadR family transcriptional regulator [Mycolicibacterium austroafricanum]QZT59608.1 PadR family transcriptional regulator [Mycolicibacterium austroafricanu